jgi:LDH2 family malate/lactate/ureidoglycolate dehydrogenase
VLCAVTKGTQTVAQKQQHTNNSKQAITHKHNTQAIAYKHSTQALANKHSTQATAHKHSTQAQHTVTPGEFYSKALRQGAQQGVQRDMKAGQDGG